MNSAHNHVNYTDMEEGDDILELHSKDSWKPESSFHDFITNRFLQTKNG